jgi:hypothetical protein
LTAVVRLHGNQSEIAEARRLGQVNAIWSAGTLPIRFGRECRHATHFSIAANVETRGSPKSGRKTSLMGIGFYRPE